MIKSVDRNLSGLWAVVVGYFISYVLICFADNLSYYLALNWYVWFFIALMLISKRYMEPGEKNSTAVVN